MYEPSSAAVTECVSAFCHRTSANLAAEVETWASEAGPEDEVQDEPFDEQSWLENRFASTEEQV